MQSRYRGGFGLRLLTPPALIALGFDRKALLDSAGHPGRPIWQSMSGATAEKASSLERVPSLLPNDPDVGSSLWLSEWHSNSRVVISHSCAAALLKYPSKSLAGISANRCARCESFRVMPRSSRVGNPFPSGTGLGRQPELRGDPPDIGRVCVPLGA